MISFAMTPAIVAAVKLFNASDEFVQHPDEPSLVVPEPGNPISHGQLIELSQYLKTQAEKAQTAGEDNRHIPVYLHELMRGCFLYTPPPQPKPEPTSEYKALMSRLRKEEESRSYERMLNPIPSNNETPTSRFSRPSQGHLFPPAATQEFEDDEMTYADVNRQMALIANVLISIIACSAALWKVAWHWNTPARLALSMVGSIVVAVAEVAIYAGYIGRVSEARVKERKKVEKKSVTESWVIEGKKSGEKVTLVDSVKDAIEASPAGGLRMRNTKGEK